MPDKAFLDTMSYSTYFARLVHANQRGGGLRQLHGILPAIEQAAVHDSGNAGLEHRLAPGNGIGRHRSGRSPALLPPGQPLDIVLPVKALAWIARVGPRRDPPAADIGIERLRLGAQPGQCFL